MSWKETVVTSLRLFSSIAVVAASLALSSGTALAEERSSPTLHAGSVDVSAWLGTFGLAEQNAHSLRTGARVPAGDVVGADRRSLDRLHAALVAMPLRTGGSLGDSVAREIRKVSAAGTDSAPVAEYLHSIRLADGARLVDVIAPELLYSRSSRVDSKEEAETGVNLIPDPGGPDVCRSGAWTVKTTTRIDSDNYFAWWHGWALTQTDRVCVGQSWISHPRHSDEIFAKIEPMWKFDYNGQCLWHPLTGSKTKVAYNSDTASVSWDRVRTPSMNGEAISTHHWREGSQTHGSGLCTA